MEYVRLGQTGLKVSRLCLGMMTYSSKPWRPWTLDAETSRTFVKQALDLGINFFDTADMYSVGGSEELTGQALRDYARREEVIIATKVFNAMSDDVNDRGLSRKHIMDSIDRSLQRLQTDYVDLYIIHRWDYETPIEETMEALHDVVKSGKARYIGASSMYAWQFSKALYTADLNGWTRFVSMQNHYNLVYREEEREMIPLCREEGIGLTPWSPFARGFLTGNRKKGEAAPTIRAENDDFAQRLYFKDSDYEVVDQVVKMAEARGVKPAQIALAWILHQPGITAPIIGATKMHHLEEAAAALEVTLSAEEIAQLEAPYQPHPILGHS